ncbi:hypothetical protein TraAM80_09255, partial [Trypanosoma rangeli]
GRSAGGRAAVGVVALRKSRVEAIEGWDREAAVPKGPLREKALVGAAESVRGIPCTLGREGRRGLRGGFTVGRSEEPRDRTLFCCWAVEAQREWKECGMLHAVLEAQPA